MTTATYIEVAAKMETTKATRRRVSLSGMLDFLGVSRSGYRAFLKHRPSESEQRKERIKERIQEIYDFSHQNYGAPKITRELQKEGERISERTVGTYMRELGIRAQWVKPWIATTIGSDFSKELHNILDEQFNPDRPNAVWCTDITYIYTHEGFTYLTSVMDLYSRKIIAWVLAPTLEAKYVVEAINLAKARRKAENPLILHSDRGPQYVSQAYREAAKKFQLSYSNTGYPYDNACIESFHSLIKREWLSRFRIESFDRAYTLIFEYIEAFYNTVRIHSHCDYMSPEQFERLYQRVAA